VKKSSTTKILKIVGIVIGVILLLLAGAIFYLNQNAEKMARKLLAKEYQGSELSQVYDIRFDAVRLNIFSGSLVIKNLHLSPHEAFYQAPDSLRFKYPMLYKIIVPKLTIKGISQNLSLNLDDIQLEEIVFSQPKITMIDYLTVEEKKQAKSQSEKQKNDTAAKSGGIESISLASFKIEGARYSYLKKQQDRVMAEAAKIDVEIQNLEYSKGQDLKSLISRTIEKTTVGIAGVSFYPDGGFYAIKVGELQNHDGYKNIVLSDIKVMPRYSKSEFGKKFGRQTDRMDVQLASLEIQDFDLEKFVLKNEIVISNIILSNLSLNAYRDKNIPLDESSYPKLPQQALAALKMGLAVDKIEVKDSQVLYEQLSAGATEVGKVPIGGVYATITHVSNISDYIAKNGSMRWDLQGNMFDAGQLKLLVSFPQNIQQADFSFSGSVGAMDMTAFNQLLVNAENIEIKQGLIQSLTFEAKANQDFAEGTLLMRYDSLKIGGLANVRDREKEELGLLAALANAVIRQFNPPAKSTEEPKVSEIFFERDKNKGIFNYLIKSLVSGIKATILPNIVSPRKQYERGQAREERKLERRERRNKK